MGGIADAGLIGRVEWIGRVRNRDESLRSDSAESVDLRFSGIADDSHGGLTRNSCVRVEAIYEIDTEIRNVRQITVLSSAELAAIAAEMGLAELSPALLGANLVVSGIPDFTHVPPSSRLQFGAGATIAVDMENLPCTLVSREIERDSPGVGKHFKGSAAGRRGITGWVEREGSVKIGQEVRLFVPEQRAWQPDRAEALG